MMIPLLMVLKNNSDYNIRLKMVDKKIALITGANKGIGFETAKRLAHMGFRVYIGSRNQSKGQIAIEKLNMEGFTDIFLLIIDVTDSKSVQNALTKFHEKEDRLDVLINNAAIGGDQPQSGSGVSLENLIRIFNTNFFGAIRVTQVFLPLMKKSPEPRIVNVSSELGSLAFQGSGSSAHFAKMLTGYSSSKTALNAFTVLLNSELSDTKFKINSVSPGLTATDLTSNNGGQTAEQASAIIVKYATLGNNGPSGEFFSSLGALPW